MTDLSKYAAGKRLRCTESWGNQVTAGKTYEAARNDGGCVQVTENDNGSPGWYSISRFAPVEDEAPVAGLVWTKAARAEIDRSYRNAISGQWLDTEPALSPGHAIREPVRLNEAQREAVGKVDPYAVHRATALAEYWLEQAATMRTEGARLESCETLEACSDELLRILPPSPPVAPKCSCPPLLHPRIRHHPGCPMATQVAPEPAQENQGPLGQKENDNGNRNDRSAATEQRQTGDTGLVRGEADPARDDRRSEGGTEVAREGSGHHQARRSAPVGRRSDDDGVVHRSIQDDYCGKCGATDGQCALRGCPTDGGLASSGEAAGDGVTHVGSAEYWHDRFSKCLAMLEETQAKQEQAEREAAGLREQLSLVERGFADLNDGCVELEKDRDAERAQKEALRAELETIREDRRLQRVRAMELDIECDRLRTERDELKRKFGRVVYLGNRSSPLDTAERDELNALLREGYAAQQPAPAAPVAKGERCAAAHNNTAGGVSRCCLAKNHLGVHRGLGGDWPNQGEDYDGWADAVAKEEATAEAKGQDPRLWFVVEGADGSYSTCQTETEARGLLKCASEWSFITRTLPVQKSRQEPAPQPPATTGGDTPNSTVHEPSWADYVRDCINNAIGEPHDPATDALIDAICSMRVALMKLERWQS